MSRPAYHSFNRLALTISEAGFGDVRTDHRFELRASERGADVWRSSVLHSGDQSCTSEARFVGRLTTRQVIELLVEIERSGIYEALPRMGLVQGHAQPGTTPLVSMELSSADQERELFDRVPADAATVTTVVRAVRAAIASAQERALAFAG